MHEMTIAQNICDVVTEEMRTIGGLKAITMIRLKVGKLSGVVPDALSFCFGFVSQGTPVEGASLQIDEVAVEAKCNGCGTSFGLEEPAFICSSCGSGDLTVLAGQELFIESIEVE